MIDEALQAWRDLAPITRSTQVTLRRRYGTTLVYDHTQERPLLFPKYDLGNRVSCHAASGTVTAVKVGNYDADSNRVGIMYDVKLDAPIHSYGRLIWSVRVSEADLLTHCPPPPRVEYRPALNQFYVTQRGAGYVIGYAKDQLAGLETMVAGEGWVDYAN